MLQTIVSSQIASAPGVRGFTGADFFEISDRWGHANLKEAARCTEAADRKRGHGQSANIDC
jgi:hypothetical protein